jgi:predicted dinucleotide-binding enzyme
MTTAIIGTGQIGARLARLLVRGGERVVVASRSEAEAAALAAELGPSARSASVRQAIADADVVVLAVWMDTIKQLLAEHGALLAGKVVVDPSNPLAPDGTGGYARSLPEGQSAGSVIAALVAPRAHYVKALGTLGAAFLESAAHRRPDPAVLFYATDDEAAAQAVERLVRALGFEPVRAGGVQAALRIEMPGGDLHQNGGLHGQLLAVDEARAAVARAAPSMSAAG